ncbi:MAG: FAD-dependent oxidoreductase [Candidatus Margulisbacteria bacterium]|nr:FAD-dependent oxidoreductase [Candidatus Margulisiibacteriota bacterium]
MQQYDIVIIGGGINGAGITLLLSLANKKVINLEKNDFSSQTSGASTKLLHGGLRYLQTYDFGLVYEGLIERSRILHIGTKRANPKVIKLIIPIYKNSLVPLWMITLGTFIYDILSFLGLPSSKKEFPFSGFLKKESVSNIIKTEDLKGLRYYYDAQVDDSRLVIDELLTAQHYGAKINNYSQVENIQYIKEENEFEVTYLDKNGQKQKIRTKKVVNTAGPWVKDVDHRAGIDSKIGLDYVAGSHIVIKQQLSKDGFFIMTKDGRNIFVLPWKNNCTLIGTTEERVLEQNIFQDNIPQGGRLSEKWRDYLIDNFNEYFQRKITKEDIIDTFWGIRVLVKKRGISANKTSRKEKVIEHYPGFVSVYGGKLTTHLAIARKIFKKLFKKEKLPKVPKLINDNNIINDEEYFKVKEQAKTPEDIKRRLGWLL